MNNSLNTAHSKTNNGQNYLIPQGCCSKYNLKYRSVIYDKALLITSNFRHSFLKKLLGQIDNCAKFEGKAILRLTNEQKKQEKKVPQISRYGNNASLGETKEYLISYCLDLVQRDGLEYQIAEKILQFERICNKIHQIIQIIMERYILQSKVSFWVHKFKEQLVKASQQKAEIKLIEQISENKEMKIKSRKAQMKPLPKMHEIFQK